MKPALSVIGLGKLGAPMVACFADKGHRVLGVDLDAAVVEDLREARSGLSEPGLQALLSRNAGRISATLDLDRAVLESELSFIIVPTPSGGDGAFDASAVISAARAIGAALRLKQAYHLIVVTSTVMPGTTGGVILAALEEASGRRCGEDFGLCYCPEFIALGSVIRDLLHPDFILIGESDPRAGDLLAALYAGVCENHPPVSRMSFVNAELAKLALNAYVTTKISFANTLARLCERLPGADVDVVTAAIGQDSRIGAKCLKGAMAFGGPCFPRDNLAFARVADRAGLEAGLANAVDACNRQQNARILELLMPLLGRGRRVTVLGLAYKPETPVVEESAAIALVRALIDAGLEVRCHDPAAMPAARVLLGDSVEFADSVSTALAGAEAVVIATPWPAYGALTATDFSATEPPLLLIDCWRILDPAMLGAGCDYFALGRAP